MSRTFAAAVRERARRADAAFEATRLGDDVEALMPAEAEWEHARRLPRRHGVSIDLGESEPGEGPSL